MSQDLWKTVFIIVQYVMYLMKYNGKIL